MIGTVGSKPYLLLLSALKLDQSNHRSNPPHVNTKTDTNSADALLLLHNLYVNVVSEFLAEDALAKEVSVVWERLRGTHLNIARALQIIGFTRDVVFVLRSLGVKPFEHLPTELGLRSCRS